MLGAISFASLSLCDSKDKRRALGFSSQSRKAFRACYVLFDTEIFKQIPAFAGMTIMDGVVRVVSGVFQKTPT